MAIVVGNTGSGSSATNSTSYSFNFNNNKDYVIGYFACIDNVENAITVSATYGGTSMTSHKSLEVNTSSRTYKVHIFGLDNASTGSNSMAFTTSPGVTGAVYGAICFEGQEASPVGATAENNAGCTVDITTTQTDSLIVALSAVRSNTTAPTITPEANQTEVFNTESGVATTEIKAAGFYRAATSITSYTVGGTTGATSGDIAIAVEIKAVSNDPPTVSLNSPADASSSSDVTPALAFTGTDPESNDIRYNVQVSLNNDFSNPVADSYTEGDSDAFIGGGKTNKGVGQSFTGNGGNIISVKFSLKKTGSPTGNVVAKIYAHSGTFGTSSVPTGSALATSDTLDISTLTTTFTLIELPFSGANQISLTNGTKYVVTIEYSGGDGSNYLDLEWDFSSPAHSGNYVQQNTGTSLWAGSSAADALFYVYTEGVVLDKVSGTDSGFSGSPDNSDPFASGQQVTYTPSGLLPDTYYWRVRGIDPTGSNSYGAFSSTRSFTITAADSLLGYEFTTNLNPTSTGTGVSGNTLSGGAGISTIDRNTSSTYSTEPQIDVYPNNYTTLVNAVSNNAYITFTITPDSGKKIDFQYLSFKAARGGSTTPRGYGVYSSIDSYASSLSNADLTNVNPIWTDIVIDLSGASFQDVTSAVTFRIYVYTPNSGNSVDFDNIFIYGTVENSASTDKFFMFFQ